MTSTVEALDRSGMACEVTSTPASGKYRIVTDYVADPAGNAILMKVAFKVDQKAKRDGLHLYVRFDPTVNGNGGGGGGNGGADSATDRHLDRPPVLVASDPNTATNAVNRDYAQPVYAALDAPVRRSDQRLRRHRPATGSSQLDASHALTTSYTTASNGNVVQTARISRGKKDDDGGDVDFTVALGFGSSQAAAVRTAESALKHRFANALDRVEAGLGRLRRRRSTTRRGSSRGSAASEPPTCATRTS